MRRRLSCFLQVASSLLVLQTALLAQHVGLSTSTTVRPAPARTFTPPASPPLWSRPGKVNHPGAWPGGGQRHDHDDGRRATGNHGAYPYFYGGLVPLGYGLPFAYGVTGDTGEQGPADSAPPAQTAEPPSSGPAEASMAASAPPLFRPMYQGPIVTAPVQAQPATRLIFKDGRPAKLVYNYALTATTLYALDDETRQEIPLSQLDLPATIQANHAAGVDFALPISR